jgi:EH domain-containing protein 1
MANKGGKKPAALDPKEVRNVIDGLKSLYKGKILPVEDMYKYADFHSPTLLDSDIESKPMVLLVGQYSTGKTTFIRYLVGRDFPGAHIGPEPTTGARAPLPTRADKHGEPPDALWGWGGRPFHGHHVQQGGAHYTRQWYAERGRGGRGGGRGTLCVCVS